MSAARFPESLTAIEIAHAEAMKEYWQMRTEDLIDIYSDREQLADAWDCIWREIDHYLLSECTDSRPEAISFIRDRLIDWTNRHTPYDYRKKLVQNALNEKKDRDTPCSALSALIGRIFRG